MTTWKPRVESSKFRPMYAGVNMVKVSFHLYFKPLGGKIFQRYPKEEKRHEKKVGLDIHDWPTLLEVTMSLGKGHHMTKGSSEYSSVMMLSCKILPTILLTHEKSVERK